MVRTNASTPLPLLAFVLRNYKNFNARATRDALLACWAHIAHGGKMFWAVAGAMSSAQLGITLAPAIRAGLIHGLSVTGANLEESLFRLVAHDSYKDFPDYRYFTKQDDTRNPRERMRRVTDTSIPEDEAFRAVEKHIVPMWKRATERGERRFWHEYFYELVRADSTQRSTRASRRVLAACGGGGGPPHRRPGPRGLHLRQHLRFVCEARRVPREHRQVGHRVHGRLLRSVPRAERRGGAWGSSKSAAASPATSRSASCHRSSTTSASRSGPGPISARISDSTTSYGSYSGATPNEKITWDKLTREHTDVRHRVGRDHRGAPPARGRCSSARAPQPRLRR